MRLERPDTGFAWVVAFCAFIINTLLSGMARMIGILYVALIDEYGVSRREASLPFIVRNAVRYLMGPLVGALGQTYGVRLVTFWGGLIAAAGSILCSFAPTVDWIVFYWGCIHGLGFSLANTLFQHIINLWFERHRATVSGLVLSGSCAASIVYPIMLQAMLDNYGVVGCFLLLGGLFLNTLPPALVLKVPSWTEFPEAYAKQRELISKSACVGDRETRQPPALYQTSTTTYWNSSVPSNDTGQLQLDGSKTRSRVFTYFDDKKTSNLWFSAKEEECNKQVICTLYQTSHVNELPNFENDSKFHTGICNPAFIEGKSSSHILDANRVQHTTLPATANPPSEAPPVSKTRTRRKDFLQNMKSIPRLYLNPAYNLISLSVATYFWMFLPLITVIVDYTRDKDIPERYEKFLIYSLTFGDMFGRLAFGWVTDKKFMALPSFMMLSFVFQGAFMALLPMSSTPVICMTVLALAGVPGGVIFVHFPVLIHNYVEEENQSIALGCMGLLSSIVSFGISPVIGYFRDQVGCYDGLFYIIAIMCVINGCLWPLVTFCKTGHDPSQETGHDPSQERRVTEYDEGKSPEAT